jgi:hypothetical protein
MLLPNNTDPKLSLYYNGALIISELKNNSSLFLFDLYFEVKKKYNMTFPIMIMSLDWLYIGDYINYNENGGGKIVLKNFKN